MEKLGAFERAVSGAHPELGQANADFSVYSEEFNYEQMKEFFLQAGEKRFQSSGTPQAQVARGKNEEKTEEKNASGAKNISTGTTRVRVDMIISGSVGLAKSWKVIRATIAHVEMMLAGLRSALGKRTGEAEEVQLRPVGSLR